VSGREWREVAPELTRHTRFYAGSSNFIPCYDPNVDTWES
jgi:hypothetical protein